MKSKIYLLLFICFQISYAQSGTNLTLKDHEVNSKNVTFVEQTYVYYNKDFGKPVTTNYTFNKDGYQLSNSYLKNAIYSKSNQNVKMIYEKNQNDYHIIKTPFKSYLALTNEVVKNSNGTIKSIYFKADKEEYNTMLDFSYLSNKTIVTPNKSYLKTEVYNEDNLLIQDYNDTFGIYYYAYDPKSKLVSLRIYDMRKGKPNDNSLDMYTLYLYEFDENQNWIVKYEYQYFPNYNNQLNQLKRIDVRYLTFENGKTSGYKTVTEAMQQKALENLKTLNTVAFNKENVPVYYEYVPKTANQVAVSNSNCTGDCQNGWGKYKYSQGSYEGYWENGKKSGFGMYLWDIGDAYMGEWKNDKMHGFGSYTYANDNGYDGSFVNGFIHGKGRFYVKSTNVTKANAYENGKFVKELDYKNNNLTRGCVNGDCDNGYGAYVYANGDKFIGEFSNLKMIKGTYYYNNGDIYLGNIHPETQRNDGYGYMYYKESGDNYYGFWKDGKFHGRAYAIVKSIPFAAEFSNGEVTKIHKKGATN